MATTKGNKRMRLDEAGFPACPAGIVFDCDGVLVDTEPCWDRAEKEMFARRGARLGPEERAQLLGTSYRATAARMAELLHERGNEPLLLAELVSSVAERIHDEAAAMEGAHRLVEAMLATSVPVAVASNSPRAIVDVALEAGGFGGMFGTIIAFEDVVHAKPAPDLYLEACRQLDVPAAQSVAFEDSAPGVASALGAGLFTICIPSPGVEAYADLMLGTLADPSLAAWVATWS